VLYGTNNVFVLGVEQRRQFYDQPGRDAFQTGRDQSEDSRRPRDYRRQTRGTRGRPRDHPKILQTHLHTTEGKQS